MLAQGVDFLKNICEQQIEGIFVNCVVDFHFPLL